MGTEGKSRIKKGLIYAVCGSVVGKLLGVVTQIVLSYLILPSDFAKATVLLGVLGSLQNLQTGSASYYVLVTSKGNYFKLGSQAFYLGLLSSAILISLVFLFGKSILKLYNIEENYNLLLFLSFGICLDSMCLARSAWLARHLRFDILNSITLVQNACKCTYQLVLASLGMGYLAITGAGAFSVLVKLILVASKSKHIPLAKPNLKCCLKVFRLSVLMNINAFLMSLSQYCALFVMSLTLNQSSSGIYHWAFGIAGQTSYMVAGALSGIFIPSLWTTSSDRKSQNEHFLKVALLTSIVLAPLSAELALFSSEITSLLFSPNWNSASSIISILTIAFICQPLHTGAQSLLIAAGRLGLLLWLNIATVLLTFSAGCSSLFIKDLSVLAYIHSAVIILTSAIMGVSALGRTGLIKIAIATLGPTAIALFSLYSGALAKNVVAGSILSYLMGAVSLLVTYLLFTKLIFPDIFLVIWTQVSSVLRDKFPASLKCK